MKTFIRKSGLFLLLIIVFIESASFILEFTNLYLINYPGKEIYHAIKKSKQKNNSKTLLLGDSVGQQLFPNETNNDEINSLACNQAIGIVGQFLLLNNYLNSGNKVDRVIMLFTPFAFQNNLNQVYTYHYFLKPFYTLEYSNEFSSTVRAQIKKIPYNQFVQVPHIRVTSWAPEFNSNNYNDFTFLSPISVEYLSKIKALSIKCNFELNIVSTPTSIDKKTLINDMNLDEIKKSNLNKEFKDYFSNIIYLKKSEFVDGIHLIDPTKYSSVIKSKILK